MTYAEIQSEISAIDSTMKPLKDRRRQLIEDATRLKSLAWIDANGVKLEDVELSDGDGKPWFGDINTFAEWLKANSKKRFCEWNTGVFFTSDIIAGRMDWANCGRLEHLQQ